jgi:hypothetical protein
LTKKASSLAFSASAPTVKAPCTTLFSSPGGEKSVGVEAFSVGDDALSVAGNALHVSGSAFYCNGDA